MSEPLRGSCQWGGKTVTMLEWILKYHVFHQRHRQLSHMYYMPFIETQIWLLSTYMVRLPLMVTHVPWLCTRGCQNQRFWSFLKFPSHWDHYCQCLLMQNQWPMTGHVWWPCATPERKPCTLRATCWPGRCPCTWDVEFTGDPGSLARGNVVFVTYHKNSWLVPLTRYLTTLYPWAI